MKQTTLLIVLIVLAALVYALLGGIAVEVEPAGEFSPIGEWTEVLQPENLEPEPEGYPRWTTR